jgi:hypothetical protein
MPSVQILGLNFYGHRQFICAERRNSSHIQQVGALARPGRTVPSQKKASSSKKPTSKCLCRTHSLLETIPLKLYVYFVRKPEIWPCSRFVEKEKLVHGFSFGCGSRIGEVSANDVGRAPGCPIWGRLGKANLAPLLWCQAGFEIRYCSSVTLVKKVVSKRKDSVIFHQANKNLDRFLAKKFIGGHLLPTANFFLIINGP